MGCNCDQQNLFVVFYVSIAFEILKVCNPFSMKLFAKDEGAILFLPLMFYYYQIILKK